MPEPPLLPDEILHAVLVRAAPEKVWEGISTRSGWDGWFTSGAEIEAREGGRILLRWKQWGPERDTGEDGGPVLEAVRPKRLVFQWHPDGPAYATTVSIDLEPDPEGTIVRLRETGYRDTPTGRKKLLDCAAGWGEAMTLLKFWAERGIRY